MGVDAKSSVPKLGHYRLKGNVEGDDNMSKGQVD